MPIPTFHKQKSSVGSVNHRRRNKLTSSPAEDENADSLSQEYYTFQDDESQNTPVVEYDLSKKDPYLSPKRKVSLMLENRFLFFLIRTRCFELMLRISL
jgi:hypothetical protein